MSLKPTPADFATSIEQKNTFYQRVESVSVRIFFIVLTLGWTIAAIRLIMLIPGPPSVFSFSSLLFLPVTFIIAFFSSILFHELGHVVAGWLVQFRLLLLIVGPFRIFRGSDGPQLSYSGFRANQFQGRVLSIPQSEQNLRRRYLWLFAGGPMATLLQVLIFITIRYLSRDVMIPVALDQFLSLMIFSPLLMVPANILPLRIQGMYTDGARIGIFLFNPKRTTYLLAQIRLIVNSIAGARPRELDSTLVQDLVTSASDSLDMVLANLIFYRHALDKGDPVSAATGLEEGITRLQDITSPIPGVGILLEAAYFEAYHNHDPLTGGAWLSQARQIYKTDHWLELRPPLLRAEAAILWAEGQVQEAALKAREGLFYLKESYDQGYAQGEKDWLEMFVAGLPSASTVDKNVVSSLPTAPKRPSRLRPIAKSLMGTFFYVTIFLMVGLVIGVSANKSLRYQLVSVYYNATGNESRALEHLSQGISELGAEEERTATLYYQRGKIYYNDKQYEEALSNFSQAVRLKPKAVYFAYRGVTYYELGWYELAAPDLNQALQSSAPDPEERIRLLLYRAFAHHYLGDIDLAVADFEEVLTLTTDPELQQKVRNQIAQLGF